MREIIQERRAGKQAADHQAGIDREPDNRQADRPQQPAGPPPAAGRFDQRGPALPFQVYRCFQLEPGGLQPARGLGETTLARLRQTAASRGMSMLEAAGNVGVLNTAISAYYYLRLIVVMFFRERTTVWNAPQIPATIGLALVITILGVLYLGVFPGRVLNALHTKPVVSVSMR